MTKYILDSSILTYIPPIFSLKCTASMIDVGAIYLPGIFGLYDTGPVLFISSPVIFPLLQSLIFYSSWNPFTYNFGLLKESRVYLCTVQLVILNQKLWLLSHLWRRCDQLENKVIREMLLPKLLFLNRWSWKFFHFLQSCFFRAIVFFTWRVVESYCIKFNKFKCPLSLHPEF